MEMKSLVASTPASRALKIETRQRELGIKAAKGCFGLLVLVALGLTLGTPSAQASESISETRAKVVKLAQSFDQFHTKYRAYGSRGAYGYPLCNRFTQSAHRGSCEAWCADFVEYTWKVNGVTHPSFGSVAPWAAWAKSPARQLWHPVTLGTFTSPNFRPQPGDLMVYGSSHIAMYIGGSGRATISAHGHFLDGGYTPSGMVTNTRKPAGGFLTGSIPRPGNPRRAPTTISPPSQTGPDPT